MRNTPLLQHLWILTGASRGMGLEIARQLLHPDHYLLCISRSASADLAHQASTTGTALEQWQQDLSDSEQSAQRLQNWLMVHERPTGACQWASATLINNAGVMPRILPLSASAPADLAHTLRVNLEAPLLLTAAFLGATEGWVQPRKVLHISSGLGHRAMASQAAYCAAKAGLDHFTRCLALEEARKPNGAQVYSLAPGVVDTAMQTQLRSADPVDFPDALNFANLKVAGQLTSPAAAATRILAWLGQPDFGKQPVADVRHNF